MRKPETKSRPLAKRLRKNMTKAEIVLWLHLRGNRSGWLFRRQHAIGPYVPDFVCIRQRLVVEVDGGTHWSAREIAHDKRRDEYLKSSGWRIVRVLNTDIYNNIEAVLAAIFSVPPLSAAACAAPDTSPVTTGEDKKASL